ncbi:glycosyltransferase [Algoriphagus vanfongensis]|uniref:glycosyltransferase n=1 Tax=Algoriphagus vanfongensis TaxID=426371 RepID=UPI0004198B74|nr:glycosyltransferase [Algoriphagus vanfongensis]
MGAWLLICCALLLVQYLVLIGWISIGWKSQAINHFVDPPSVSILVAARNEEEHLPRLLDSFARLKYPSSKIQFLFVDDQSTDSTLDILKEWCKKRKNARVIISQTSHSDLPTNYKAKALAELSDLADGDYFLFTDADCVVNSDWIQGVLAGFSEKTGMVVGVTQVCGSGLLQKFQELDWWHTEGFLKVSSDLGILSSGMGNNMAISRSAYIECGGFHSLPFSMTEDLEITKVIQSLGYEIRWEVRSETKVQTKAELGLARLLKQRKRWMAGVMTLPFYWKLVLAIQFLYFPFVGWMIYQLGPGILFLALVKSALQACFLRLFAGKAGVKLSFTRLLAFDFYFFPTTSLTILYYFWPSPIQWKSRIYP